MIHVKVRLGLMMVFVKQISALSPAIVCSIFLSFAISKEYWAIKSNYAPLGNNLYLEAFEEGKIPQLHLVKWLHMKEMTP